MGLLKIGFGHLKTGMLVSRGGQVYEALGAAKENALLMKDNRTAVLITKAEFDKHEWFTVVKRRHRRTHG